MAFLTIDETRCKQDGICAAECPRGIISRKDNEGFPQIVEADEADCMACGHCVAVCPHGALSVEGVDIEGCHRIESDLTLSWDQAEQFLRSRRSIRVFKDKAVDKMTLERLIGTARYAPTASNAQNLVWTVIDGRDKLVPLSQETIRWMRRVIAARPGSPAADYFHPLVTRWEAGYDSILRTARTLIVASAPKENANGLVDLSIALAYLELAALPLGVGTCWAGLLQAAMLACPELVETMGLPTGHTWFYPMMIGYPKFQYHRLPQRNPPMIRWR